MKVQAVLAFVGVLSLASTLQPAAAAAPANQVFMRIPTSILEVAIPRGAPMRDGLVGHNMNGWLQIGMQRGGVDPIKVGAIHGDAALVNRYWSVIDVSFAHQLPDGSFDYASVINGVPQREEWQPSGAAFWIGESAEALLLLRGSKLAPKYASRIDALIPRFRRTLDYLAQPDHVNDMIRADRGATNRLFEDAKALLLGSDLANFPQARPAGDHLLQLALGNQAPDGYFTEHGGPDTNYNAVSALKLAEIILFDNRYDLMPALQRSAQWEIARVDPSGTVGVAGNTRTGMGQEVYFGAAKNVSYPTVASALGLYSAMTGQGRAAAARLAAKHRADCAAMGAAPSC